MHAAVVSSFDVAPRYAEVPTPRPAGDEALVHVIASGLHPRVRSQADGSHYTSTDALPLVPGIDGVGRTPDGRLCYFVLPDTTMGAMAEQTVVDLRRGVVLPEGSDPIQVAAAMNPALSSWVALRRRIAFAPGQHVLVLGATGSSGRLAVQVAKLLGAGHVTAAGRDARKLAAVVDIGADTTVSLSGDPEDVARRLGEAGRDVDVVLDYLWGPTTADAMLALAVNRTDRGTPLTWIEIGSVTGPTAAIPSAALRAARLTIVGSGQGSVTTREILAELSALADHITRGALHVAARAVALDDVERAWTADGDERVVITP